MPKSKSTWGQPKKWRYFCPACTGRAFYSVEPEEFLTRTCGNCGHIVEFYPENYFQLDQEEFDKVNNAL